MAISVKVAGQMGGERAWYLHRDTLPDKISQGMKAMHAEKKAAKIRAYNAAIIALSRSDPDGAMEYFQKELKRLQK